MKKFLLFVLLSISFESQGQSLFSITIGDTINQVMITKSLGTSDGGFLFCGRYINYAHPYRRQAVLLKLNLQGDTSWTAILSDTNCMFFSAVELPLQQGFICTGINVICRFDTSGNLIWKKVAGLDAIIVSGNTLLASSAGGVVNIDFNGNVIWATKPQNFTGVYDSYSILQLSNGDIFVASGIIDTYGVNPALYKLDANGNFIWARNYSFYNFDLNGSFISMDTASDGNLILVATYGDAHTWSWSNIEYTKIDTSGNTIWTRFLPNPGAYRSNGKIFQISDSTYGLFGYSDSFGSRIYFLTMDTSGIPLSTKLFPTEGENVNVERLNNHQLLFSHTNVNGQITSLYLLDSVGNSFCNMIDTTAIVVDTTPMPASVINPIVSFPPYIFNNISDSLARGLTVQTNCISTSAGEIESENLKQEIIIYPNPARNQFAIRSLQFAKNSRLEIFNSLGEKIYSDNFSGQSRIDSRQFTRGIYFVRLSNSESVLTKKLLIE